MAGTPVRASPDRPWPHDEVPELLRGTVCLVCLSSRDPTARVPAELGVGTVSCTTVNLRVRLAKLAEHMTNEYGTRKGAHEADVVDLSPQPAANRSELHNFTTPGSSPDRDKQTHRK